MRNELKPGDEADTRPNISIAEVHRRSAANRAVLFNLTEPAPSHDCEDVEQETEVTTRIEPEIPRSNHRSSASTAARRGPERGLQALDPDDPDPFPEAPTRVDAERGHISGVHRMVAPVEEVLLDIDALCAAPAPREPADRWECPQLGLAPWPAPLALQPEPRRSRWERFLPRTALVLLAAWLRNAAERFNSLLKIK